MLGRRSSRLPTQAGYLTDHPSRSFLKIRRPFQMPSLEFQLYLKEMRSVFLGMKKKKKLASILSTFLGTCWSCDACFNVVVGKCIAVVVENSLRIISTWSLNLSLLIFWLVPHIWRQLIHYCTFWWNWINCGVHSICGVNMAKLSRWVSTHLWFEHGQPESNSGILVENSTNQ